MEKVTTTGNKFIDASLDFNVQVVTSTGLLLILDKDLTNYAERKKIKNTKVFLVMENGKVSELVILQDNRPVYTSQKMEEIAVHLDIMAIADNE